MPVSPDEPAKNIAANVRRLRRKRGWTQEQAGRVMHEHGGPLWSKAGWSWAERSVDGKRVRQFTAHELAVLAEIFEVEIGELFAEPPEEPVTIACPRCEGEGTIQVLPSELAAEDDES